MICLSVCIWISHQNDNRFHVDVPYLLCHVSVPSYKHIRIWYVIFYVSNGRVTRKNLDDRSHCGYFVVYSYTTVVILYCKRDHSFSIRGSHYSWFDEYNYHISMEDKHTPGSLPFQQYPDILLHNSYLI